jgi:hypothetical protein
VPAGHAAVDLRRLPSGQEIEVDTPNGAFLISHTGYYRFDVDDAATRFSARHGGLARVVPAGGGDEVEIGSTQQVVVSGTETARLERVALSSDDAWDRWNADRMAGLSDEPRSARYVSHEVAGVDDLDRYGDWHDTPSYGSVCAARRGGGLVALQHGSLGVDGYYGWTWVDDAPWGGRRTTTAAGARSTAIGAGPPAPSWRSRSTRRRSSPSSVVRTSACR